MKEEVHKLLGQVLARYAHFRDYTSEKVDVRERFCKSDDIGLFPRSAHHLRSHIP